MSRLIPFLTVSAFVLLSASAASNGRWLVALGWMACAGAIVAVEWRDAAKERRLLERVMRLLKHLGKEP